ncbi:MAG: 3-phosphoshikimate 1-carboxyvinyltransferase [Nitrospinaceae bacterium]|nr:3-phosphoshikimate 1-carboxyvinyltransferase [Nitrospinaceae bacterium]NIR56311.1 3-phosphoshikimate 1-carboxyvinyltransferase [Nitrospinaceae bacterium]NIS86768.1 3-phosphoshikimate 1-carboxyvinyltransferase [Nitrospinaceae bacterium]NIT83603.1 3-phosphoshikimate 1-carboxyvinyltransferase [Nitrospinaceae bacterium]NIU45805.1 3-phosphoshikimate 1-carboxyvinyltransferase [Nitrospinaceae bacterium]
MIEIRPTDSIRARVAAPPSKSYTNRAYIIAALAEGEVRLENPLFSDDTRYMREALVQFGVPVTEEPRAAVIQGRGGRLKVPEKEIFVGNAGTTMRFLATFASLAPGTTRLTGDERMQERPIEDLLAGLRQLGLRADSALGNGCPPIEIGGGPAGGGEITLAGDKSSQYLTSLLLSAPYFQNNTTVNIEATLTSRSYVDITLDIMQTFGVPVKNEFYRSFHVPAGRRYLARSYDVEGDASSASYFFAAAAITGGEVTVSNLNPDSVQGDIQFPNALEQMGCGVERRGEKITVFGNPLRGITIHMNDMPDVVQTLAVVALFAEGKTTITGIGNLKIKETDRIAALANELSRLGATVEAGEDFIIIEPGSYRGVEVETYNDHRMAMSFALAGLRIPGIKITNPRCVDKSFPDFFERFQEMYG